MKPESRRESVLAQGIGDELVVYDERSHEAHRLSPTAAAVWKAADGARSIPELAALLRASVAEAATVSDADGDELVQRALLELDRVGLLVRGLPGAGESMSRREMIGVAAALLPVIASIVAPEPVAALSVAISGTYSGTGEPIGENPCGLSGGPVTVTINETTSTVEVRHNNFNTTFTYTGASITNSFLLPSASASAPSGVAPGFVVGAMNLTITRTGNQLFLVGTQNIGSPTCGTSQFRFTASKPV